MGKIYTNVIVDYDSFIENINREYMIDIIEDKPNIKFKIVYTSNILKILLKKLWTFIINKPLLNHFVFVKTPMFSLRYDTLRQKALFLKTFFVPVKSNVITIDEEYVYLTDYDDDREVMMMNSSNFLIGNTDCIIEYLRRL